MSELTFPALVVFLLLDGPLGCREGFEAVVRDRLVALDRPSVRTLLEPRLRPLDGAERLAQVVADAFVQLVGVELGRPVRGLVLICKLADIRRLPPCDALSMRLRSSANTCLARSGSMTRS